MGLIESIKIVKYTHKKYFSGSFNEKLAGNKFITYFCRQI